MRSFARLKRLGLLIVMGLLVSIVWPATALAATRFVVPVDGRIVRRFEPPPAPYASGHRGIDFDVAVGTAVKASASGEVKFAGPVASNGLFVTISHSGGLETTYSFLSTVTVSAGDSVELGDEIAASGLGHPEEMKPLLHFGAKANGRYIDPEVLLFGKLSDISQLIALAPLDAQPRSFARGGTGGLSPFERDTDGDKRGFFERIGSGIHSAGSWVVGGVVGGAKWAGKQLGGAGSWVWSKAKWAGRGIGSAALWTKDRIVDGSKATGRGLATAWDWTKRTGKSVAQGLGKFFGKVGNWLNSAASQVGKLFSWVWKGVKKAGGFVWRMVTEIGKGFGRGIGKVFKRIKLIGKSLLKRLWLIVEGAKSVVHITIGAVKQIGCSIRGGGKAPDIPTPQEVKQGKKPPKAPNDNIVIAVAGIGSSTERNEDGTFTSNASMYNLDLTTLGFDESQIYYFSYEGIEPQADQTGPYRIHDPYRKEDTFKGIEDSAEELERQVLMIASLNPSSRIDIVAHSQGGVVAQYFLSNLYDVDEVERPLVDHFVSIASPHRGADAAQIYERLADTAEGKLFVEGVDKLAEELDLPPPSAPAARDLAEESDFIKDVTEDWDPSKAKTATLAASLDYVVTPRHSRLEGSERYTVDMPNEVSSVVEAHGSVVNAPNTKEILYNWLADDPSACTSLRNALADHGTGKVLEEAEDTVIDFVDLLFEGVSASNPLN